jgi:hypothetical protein
VARERYNDSVFVLVNEDSDELYLSDQHGKSLREVRRHY